MPEPSLTLWDKLLPDQALNNEHYSGRAEDYHQTLYGLIARTSGLKPATEQFTVHLSDRVSVEQMASNPVQLRFLQMMVKLTGAKRVLEIGAFIGLSAMAMASVLPEDGKLVTVEKFDHFADIARRNFAANGLDDKITLLQGDAFEALDSLPNDVPFDMVFIDGNKERYAHYFEVLEPLVRPGGLIVVDDVFFHGDVLSREPQTEKGRGVKAFMDLAARRDGFLSLALPLSNGIMMMLKPEA